MINMRNLLRKTFQTTDDVMYVIRDNITVNEQVLLSSGFVTKHRSLLAGDHYKLTPSGVEVYND